MDIETLAITLPHGISLSVRSAKPQTVALGSAPAPVLLFLHGFPEGAFIWDDYLSHFAQLGFHCVAPNLRGFEHSSAPLDASAYRPKHLVQDIAALIAHLAPGGQLAALIAHDWGGAVAWNLANQQPELLRKLVIINSPHPVTFLRELQRSQAQRDASGYMNFLARPDAPQLLAASDFARLWPFFGQTEHGGIANTWMTDALKAQYRSLWQLGLHGGCNYYAASPLRPETAAALTLPPEAGYIQVPTQIIWGEQDAALRPELLDGLDAYIPDLKIHRIPHASHWATHEAPQEVMGVIGQCLTDTLGHQTPKA